jgi:hypothetical protein
MRVMAKLLMIACVLAACSGDALRDDMKMFCRAADVTNGKTVVEIAPYIADRMKTDELKHLMLSLKDGTTTFDLFVADANALVTRAKLEDCRTIKVLTTARAAAEQ